MEDKTCKELGLAGSGGSASADEKRRSLRKDNSKPSGPGRCISAFLKEFFGCSVETSSTSERCFSEDVWEWEGSKVLIQLKLKYVDDIKIHVR